MSIWRWSKWLPDIPPELRLDIGTGETPLVRSRRIGPAIGLKNLFFKLETNNPTGSYKDRFGAVAISAMLAAGEDHCVATSSGNSGAALAAHCGAAEIRCEIAVIITAPTDKLLQMRAYGADIYRVNDFGIDKEITHQSFEYIRWLGQQPGAALQISSYSYSPIGMEGIKTISFEIAEQCPEPVDHLFSPVGGGGLTLSVANGFENLLTDDLISHLPRIECVQPEGNNTVAGPLINGKSEATPIERCDSRISGLQCPSILDGNKLIPAARRSGGTGHLVSDNSIWAAQQQLAQEEGIFCEPAGAVSLAGALQAHRQGRLDSNVHVVCLITGSGFKDSASVERMIQGNLETRDLSKLIEKSGAPITLNVRENKKC